MQTINMATHGSGPDKLVMPNNGNALNSDLFALMLDKIASPVTYISKDYRYKYVNKAYADWVGINSSDITGSYVEDFLGYESFARIKPYMDAAMNGEEVHYEEEIPFKHGLRFIEATYTPDVDEKGNVRGYVALINDVTIKKNAEKALQVKQYELKNNREHYQKLLSTLPVAVYTCDNDGRITFFNEAAASLWGRHPDIEKEMWCGSLKILEPDGTTPLPLDTYPMALTLKEGKKIDGQEIIIERPDGSRKHVLAHPEPLYDMAGNLTGAVNLLLDITERKVAEEYQAKLAAIVQFSDDVIISKTTDGIITSWNPAAERLYGFTEKEMIGQSVSTLIPEDRWNEEPEILERIKRGERVPPFETKRITKSGKLVDVSITISPIKDAAGNVIGASKIAQDISKKIEERKRISESEERLRMAGESTFLGTWEFNPLTKKRIWSDECKKIFGLSLDKEPDDEFVAEHIYPEDTENIQHELDKALNPFGSGNFKMEYRITRDTDKQVRWLKVHGKAIFDDDKKPYRIIGTMLDITEEKLAVQLVRESEERFRMAVESTNLGTWEYQPQTGKLTWSDECRKIFDVPLDMQVDFDFFARHIFPEDKEYAETEISKAMDPSGHGNYDIQYRIIRHTDKQPRWIRAQGKVYFDDDQKPQRFIGTVLDITKEKLQQEELIESVELFQTMADNVPAMIWMSGTDKFNDYFNRAWLDFTGRTLDAESNEGWLEGVHPDDVQNCIDTYNESLKKQEGFYTEYRLRRIDGQYRWIADNSVPRYSPEGVFLGFISACIDIDDQKRFREKIMDSELLFKTISNTSPAALWMTDQNGSNVFVSDTWLRWVGSSMKEQVNRGWVSFVLEEDREKVINRFMECFAERKFFSAEFRLPDKDGHIRWCLTEGKPYFDINGSFAGYAGSVTDITEIKQLEQRKDDFIKMASHELKTPITSITGYVQLLLNIYNDAEAEKIQMSRSTVRSSLTTIAKQVSKLTRLISELLDLSKIESGKLELNCAAFDLTELVEETVQDVRHTTSQHAIIVSGDFEGKVYGDKDRIGQVLTNILNNSIKYSPGADCVEVYVSGDREMASVKVKDFGIGIDKKEHRKIFERFYRVEGKMEQTYPGFGIGLFIAGEIIQRHNGTIDVHSEKGQGSVFIINLPIEFNHDSNR